LQQYYVCCCGFVIRLFSPSGSTLLSRVSIPSVSVYNINSEVVHTDMLSYLLPAIHLHIAECAFLVQQRRESLPYSWGKMGRHLQNNGIVDLSSIKFASGSCNPLYKAVTHQVLSVQIHLAPNVWIKE